MIKLVPFSEDHIEKKVKWINDSRVHQYLHYDIPLSVEGTTKWFFNKEENRLDYTILYNDSPVGIIGLLNIRNGTGEFYITIGEPEVYGKGVGYLSSVKFLNKVFSSHNISNIYLTTEKENKKAHGLFRKLGFLEVESEGSLKKFELSAIQFYIGLEYRKYPKLGSVTPITGPFEYKGNNIYVKRDDLYPLASGGNKAKKIDVISKTIPSSVKTIITYGSVHSNHVRSCISLAAKHKYELIVVTPKSKSQGTTNLYKRFFDFKVVFCELDLVSETIQKLLGTYDDNEVFFIPGGGHLPSGTDAYIQTYEEIRNYELKSELNFKYIVHGSGTGGTQAGLILGSMYRSDPLSRIIGISVGRKKTRAIPIIIDTIKEYVPSLSLKDLKGVSDDIQFYDNLVDHNYGNANDDYDQIRQLGFTKFDIELDPIYTGKSFQGMLKFLEKKKIKGENILFIHTGGTPIYYEKLLRTDI